MFTVLFTFWFKSVENGKSNHVDCAAFGDHE